MYFFIFAFQNCTIGACGLHIISSDNFKAHSKVLLLVSKKSAFELVSRYFQN